jgi:hypothetical protein
MEGAAIVGRRVGEEVVDQGLSILHNRSAEKARLARRSRLRLDLWGPGMPPVAGESPYEDLVARLRICAVLRKRDEGLLQVLTYEARRWQREVEMEDVAFEPLVARALAESLELSMGEKAALKILNSRAIDIAEFCAEGLKDPAARLSRVQRLATMRYWGFGAWRGSAVRGR